MSSKQNSPEREIVPIGVTWPIGLDKTTEVFEKPSGLDILGSKRFNLRAIFILLGIALALPAIYFPISIYQDRALRQSALARARALFEEGHSDQALANLDSYLENWPEDLAGLELLGELMVKTRTTSDQVFRGIGAIDKLLRLDPDPPARQDDRKRLVQLSIRLGDMVRASAERGGTAIDKFEGRYQYANNIANLRIKLGADDGESHRLLAMTLERLANDGNPKIEADAIQEYQKALRKDPGDFYSAERMAALRLEKRKDQAGADGIVDNLIKARPRSVEARLVRARHFLNSGREDRATLDLEVASKLDQTNMGIRKMSASLAVRRGDLALAKRHLASIPEKDRDSDQDVLLARIEFLEQRPEQAIEKLRKGLARSSGSDLGLSFRLAYILIQVGRSTEARPLIGHLRRLSGRENPPMVRLLEGTIKERTGRFVSAITDLESVRDDITADWKYELEMMLGRCYEATGNFNAATTAYTAARNLVPSSVTPRQSLARVLLQTKPDRSVNELEEAIRQSHGQETHGLLADLAHAQAVRQLALAPALRDWSTVESAIDQGLRAKPDFAPLILARATLLTTLGRHDEAEATLAEATKGTARRSAELWLARSSQLEGRGRFDEALRVLEQASNPNASGDQSRLRLAKANLLVRTGHGRSALELLSLGAEKLPASDRAMLAKARAKILLSMGDKAGAQAVCVQWAGQAPEDPEPALMMIEMARRGGTEEQMELGFKLLLKAGGNEEPTLIAARAVALLLPRADSDEVDVSKLDQVEALSQRLQEMAPDLPATALVRAILLEQSSGYEEAIADYKLALKKDTTGLALPRLVALLTRLKRTNDLNALKSQTTSPAVIDRLAIRESLDSGDKDEAEALLSKLVAAQPDSLEYRADLAKLLRDLGKPEQGEAILRALVDRRPELPQPWLALLALQLERGDKAVAAATVDRLRTTYKGERADLLLARCLWAIGNREGAAKVASGELATHPEDLETIRLVSEIEEASGRMDRAEALITKARKLNPNLPWTRRRLALLLSARPGWSRWKEAKALLEPSSSGSDDSPDDRLIRAIVLERGPDPSSRSESISVLRSLADDLPLRHPLVGKVRLLLAQLLLRTHDASGAAQAMAPLTGGNASPDLASLAVTIEALSLDGKPDDARRLLELLTKAHPDSQVTTVCRALVLKADGDLPGAAAAILDAAVRAEKTPDGERVSRYYFDQLVQLGADEAAEQLGRSLVAKWPSQRPALARFLATKGRIDEALALCRSAAEAGPSQEALSVLLVMDGQGQLDGSRAEKVKELAVSSAIRSPKSLDVLSMAVTLLRRHHQFEDEAALYRKLLAADPSNNVARNNLAWVLGHDLGRPAEGLVEVDRVIRQAGTLSNAVDTRGMILAKMGRINEAIADLERSVKIAPTAVHQIHLARAYAQAGRPEDHRRALEAAKLTAVNPKSLEPEDLAELNPPSH